MAFDIASAKPVEESAPAAAPKPKFDVATAKPVAAVDHSTALLPQVAAEEENPNLVAVGKSMMAIPEAVMEIAGKVGGKNGLSKEEMQGRAAAGKALGEEAPLSRIVGAGTDVVLGGSLPAGQVRQGAGSLMKVLGGAGTGAVYGGLQPTAGTGDFATEKAKQVGTGVAVGGGLTGAVESIVKGAPWLRSIVDKIFSSAPATAIPPRGESAGKVAGELQRQRDISEGKKGIPAGNSEFERARSDFDTRMAPIKDAAFNAPGKIDTADTVRIIDQMMLQNPDKQVQAALREVKGTIERATKGQATAGLPPAGATMSAAQLKQMQGSSGQLDMKMADEVRQSINRQRDQTGDKALSKHTVDLLTQVRDRFMQNAPQPYKDWIAAHAKGAQELERFGPDAGVLAKTTTAQPGVQPLAGVDAQKNLDAVFSGKTAGRDLQDIMGRVRHDPAALEGVKRAVTEWITPPNQSGKVNIESATSNWNKAKQAIKEAEVFVPEHYAAIDKVMKELHGTKEGGDFVKSGVAAGAWLLGLPFGRPGSAAMLGRAGVEASRRAMHGNMEPAKVEQMISKVMSDPYAARIAAAPPTPENMKSFEAYFGGANELSQTGAVMGSRAATKPDEPRERRPNPLGMTPRGVPAPNSLGVR